MGLRHKIIRPEPVGPSASTFFFFFLPRLPPTLLDRTFTGGEFASDWWIWHSSPNQMRRVRKFWGTPVRLSFRSIFSILVMVHVISRMIVPHTIQDFFFLKSIAGFGEKKKKIKMSQRTPLRPGVYCPTVTFFHPDTDELDTPTIRKHAVRLARAGVVGIVAMGSNGEAVHLSRAERQTVIRETRAALDAAGFRNVPIIAGASDQSVRGSVELARDAAEAGAEYVLVLPPSYYRYAVGSEESLYDFFTGVAEGSPLPVIIYNYPGVVAGIDMDSDLIIRISQHPNIVGTKFTCANTGKLTRVARALKAITPPSPFPLDQTPSPNHPTKSTANHPYVAFGGIADFTLQCLISGGSATIVGTANVAPRTCVQVFNLWSEGKLAEAYRLQKILADGDGVLSKVLIPGTKQILQAFFGYGGYPRPPLRRLDDAAVRELQDKLQEMMAVENSLPDFAAS